MSGKFGGSQPGSGRKPGITQTQIGYKIDNDLLELLHKKAPKGKRNALLNKILRDYFSIEND